MIVSTLEPSRHLPLAGTHNLRDAGGYETRDGNMIRWRTFFRSDSLHRLTPAGQEALLAHGLRTVVDLRRPEELEIAPNVFAATTAVRYVHEPLMGDRLDGGELPSSLEEFYRRILEQSQGPIALVIGALAQPESFPALVHCTAGKDRTGLIVALVLGVAQVPHEKIAADYALSAHYLSDLMGELRHHGVTSGFEAASFERMLGSPAQAMRVTLEYVDERYGSVTGYLKGIGVCERKLVALRDALIE